MSNPDGPPTGPSGVFFDPVELGHLIDGPMLVVPDAGLVTYQQASRGSRSSGPTTYFLSADFQPDRQAYVRLMTFRAGESFHDVLERLARELTQLSDFARLLHVPPVFVFPQVTVDGVATTTTRVGKALALHIGHGPSYLLASIGYPAGNHVPLVRGQKKIEIVALDAD